MESFISVSNSKRLSIFLNISFLILLSFYLTTHLSNSSNHSKPSKFFYKKHSDDCLGLHDLPSYESKCVFVISQPGCSPGGYIDYLHIFYCTCGQYPFLGYAILLLCLVLLFYISGDTVANYFCSSLDSLSHVLKLSPTIAGVTLLSLGNGASDVFACIVSFDSGDADVGLNTILGGAFFVSSTVLGIISLVISPYKVSIDRQSFIRDVIFLLVSLAALLLILLVGKINLFGAICFLLIYVLYVCSVSLSHYCSIHPSSTQLCVSLGESGDSGIPLLGCVDEEKANLADKATNLEDKKSWSKFDTPIFYYLGKFLCVVEMPIFLPRRLTIPMVNEEKWSKPFAVVSVTLAPILLAFICNSQREKFEAKANLITYMTAGLVGLVLGNLAFVTTKACHPPKTCLFPWLAGGFLMSVAWTYMIAEELVSLLVAFGTILGISPSILGLTVLAWGNSLGDLIANVTMAKNGGPDGAQIAISGCHAGPMFNTVIGLGVSLVFASWSTYPSHFVIPRDTSLYETLGFFMCGLLWALVILPRKNMRVDRFLGGGLLAIYFCFLSLRLAKALGLLNSH